MTTREQLQACMVQLGELQDDIESIVESGDGDEWEIEMDDESVIEVEFDEERQRIALSCVLGAPEPEHRAHTCEMLLTFNLLWQEDMPLRMALGSPGEDVVQVAELALPDPLSAQDLQTWLTEFSASAAHWRQHVASGFRDMQDAPAQFLDPGAFRA